MSRLSTNLSTAETPALHPWNTTGQIDAEGLEAWVRGRLAWQEQQINRLLAVEGSRTLENTLRPYDDAVATLSATGSLASLLDSVYPDKAVRDKARELTQAVAEVATALSLNRDVYQALAAIDMTSADAATAHYVSQTLLNYRLAGVDKDDATRARIRELSDKATEISLLFAKNVQENVNKVEVHDAKELAGLPEDYLRNHPADDSGVITLTTDYPDMQPVMTFASDSGLRQRMFLAYNTRAYPANRPLLLELLALRQQVATILGFSSWADLATANQMMGSAAKLKQFISDLEAASREGAKKEYEMVLAFARKQEPGLTNLKSSDRGYWYEQFRRDAFDFDSQSVRPYFPYESVQKGILETAARLFHVAFQPNHEVAVWHPHVTAWDVLDHGRVIGRFYLDMHPREGKDKWFSAAPLIPGIAGSQLPEVALICNFPGGRPDDPGLMQYSDVVTFFHEFGHLMHAILGGHQKWAGVSGIATEGDFVEVPSQMLEEFFHDAGFLASFASPLPDGRADSLQALVERMNQRQRLWQSRWGAHSALLHQLLPRRAQPAGRGTWIQTRMLRSRATSACCPTSGFDGNRMYASFTHLIGYTSNYYTYMFDKVIALDFFRQFDQANLLEGPAAMRYRKSILEPGGSKPGTQLIQDFLGREQKMDAFSAWVGEEFAV